MKRIHIVSHCYATELPHYADALVYQLSSFVLHPPEECIVEVTVCCDYHDENTGRVVRWFLEHRPNLKLNTIYLTPQELGRRAIGRNRAAKTGVFNFVWFADCDQIYRDGILDRLATMEWPEGAVMVFPRQIMIHRDHATGSKVTAAVGDDVRLMDADTSLFVPKQYHRAIGGVQIVQGDFAREHGYLDCQPDWRQPVEKPFSSFKDDIIYRRHCLLHGQIVGVDLPGVYRIRHARTTHR